MLSLTMVFLANFITQAHSRDANHTLTTQDSMQKLSDRLVNSALEATPLHNADLDDTLLAKTGSLVGGSPVTMRVTPCYRPSTQLASPCFRLNSLPNTESSSSVLRGRKYTRTMMGHAISSKKVKWPASRIRWERDNRKLYSNDFSEELRAISASSHEGAEAGTDNNRDMERQ